MKRFEIRAKESFLQKLEELAEASGISKAEVIDHAVGLYAHALEQAMKGKEMYFKSIMKDVIIFDLDGTICDVEHRRKFVASKPKNWNAWNKGLSADKPHLPVRFIFDCISYMVKTHTDITIAFVSGRSEEYRDETIHWLNLNGFGNYTHNLYMRKEKDNRNDAIIKSEIADEIEKEYNILCVFDDRKRVVDMWINRGIFVFDVGQGKGDF